MPPPSVRLRIYEREGGRCHLSGRKIRPGEKWELDHIVPLWDGGENVESNLAPVLVESHKRKTAEDKRKKAKSDRVKMRSLGIRKRKGRGFRGWRRFNGEAVYAGDQE